MKQVRMTEATSRHLDELVAAEKEKKPHLGTTITKQALLAEIVARAHKRVVK